MLKHLETLAQERVVMVLRRDYPQALFSGGFAGENLHRGYRARPGVISPGKRKQLMGYKPGTPDLFIFEHRKGFCGLAIEMKAPQGGSVSKEQKAFLEALRARNWHTAVCRGSREAIDAIRSYMDNN